MNFCHAVDLAARVVDIAASQMSVTTENARQPRRKWRRWIVFCLVLGLPLWLNGPGLRWLGPIIAAHYLEKAGLHGSFRLEGSLAGGISVSDLHLEGAGAVASVHAQRVVPLYQIGELIRGRASGLEIDGLHLELRLTEDDGKSPAGQEMPSLDLNKLVESIRMAREKALPLSINLENISLNATRDGKPLIALTSSNLHHQPGSVDFKINLGAMTDAKDRIWPAQESVIAWNADVLTIDHIDPLPGTSIRGLKLNTPSSGGLSLEAEVHLEGAVFVLTTSPGCSLVNVNLREGAIASEKIAERLGLQFPVRADITSLAVNINDLLPEPKAASCEVRLLLEHVDAAGWRMPELSLDVDLKSDSLSLNAAGQALGTRFSMDAAAPLDRMAGEFSPAEVKGRFRVDDVPSLVASLSEKFKTFQPKAAVPASRLDGEFEISLKNLRPMSADVALALKPEDAQNVSALTLKSRWQPEKSMACELSLDGLKASAVYKMDTATYEGKLDFDNLSSARVDRWVAVAGMDSKGAVTMSGNWHGGGNLKDGRHNGELRLANAGLKRGDATPVSVEGTVHYDWPSSVKMNKLLIQTNDQLLGADMILAGGLLEITDLRWRNQQTDMAVGTARLPVPEDFSKWRDMLANDKQPVEVTVESKAISLGLLNDWLPAAAKLDARSTGQLRMKVTGTYADPMLNVSLEAANLRSPSQPNLPPASLAIGLSASGGILKVSGKATAPDFPPALMTASMPFRPAEWARDSTLIREEPVSARIDLPRLDLSRYSSLITAAKKLSGTVTGSIEAGGTIGKPAVKGVISLSNAGFEPKSGRYPALNGIGLVLDIGLNKVTLKDLKGKMAGGTLAGSGSLVIENGKPDMMDVRFTGRHLPLLRDDSVIVRANTDLKLAGKYEKAALTGTVGVVNSLFYRDIELLPIGTPFTEPSVASLPKFDTPGKTPTSMPEPFRNWTLDVLARTENPFLIRGNFATGSVEANVRVGGTLGNPVPIGQIKLSGIRASLPFSTLVVPSGILRFDKSTGFDPLLEIRGTAEPRPYRVSVFVYGRASDPQLVLTSSPPLPDNEIMTLLATGTTTSGLENPQAASSRAMQLLAEEMRRGRFGVGKKLRPLLGLLDRVNFSLAESDPYSSDSFSTATISITDRWFLSAGMGADGDSRVMGIWRISFR